MPANQTLSVYLPKDLWEKVQEAEQSSNFKATEFCKTALVSWFDPESSGTITNDVVPQTQPGVLEERPDGSSTLSFSEQLVGQVGQTAEEFEYEIKFLDTITSGIAYLNDVVQPQGGYPISMTSDVAGRIGFLIGWPKQA